jgi:DNA repair protein RadC
VAHNHPSGDISPSKADREMTVALLRAGETLHIPVMDHVIIGTENGTGRLPYFSFRASGLIHS